MLLHKLKKDQVQARKNRHTVLAQFLTTLYAEACRPGLDDGKRDSTDVEVTAVIKKFIKNANEVMANLPPLDSRSIDALAEIVVLETYLPTQLSEDDLDHIIANIIGSYKLDSMKGLGIIMKVLNTEHAGTFDGQLASKIAKTQLMRNAT